MLGIKLSTRLTRFLKSLTRKKENEKPDNSSFKENPKTLLQTYGRFLCAVSQDGQRYDKARKGLVSFEHTQPRKPIPLVFSREGEVFVNHCANGGTKLSQGQTIVFKSNLASMLNRIRDNMINMKGYLMGKELDRPVFQEGIDCAQCKTRFRLSIRFDWDHITILLMKLHTLDNPIVED